MFISYSKAEWFGVPILTYKNWILLRIIWVVFISILSVNKHSAPKLYYGIGLSKL